jgi:dephospho-CoA kinase
MGEDIGDFTGPLPLLEAIVLISESHKVSDWRRILNIRIEAHQQLSRHSGKCAIDSYEMNRREESELNRTTKLLFESARDFDSNESAIQNRLRPYSGFGERWHRVSRDMRALFS